MTTPRYIIDTDTGTCTLYTQLDVDKPPTAEKGVQILNHMAPYLGTKEYDGIVADIQKWYYGSLIKASWCATCVSYFLNKVGVTDVKSENVFVMYKQAFSSKSGRLYHPGEDNIKKGDIVFLCFDKQFNTTAAKHVTVCQDPGDTNYFIGRGGNQDDSLCDKQFDNADVVAFWRLS